MDDYLSEQEQWEFLKGWIRANGPWIVAGLVLGAAILGGWRWYQGHADQQGIEAQAKYQQILTTLTSDRTKALSMLQEMEHDYSGSPYLDQAKLAVVHVYVDTGELDKASTELQSVMQHTKDPQLALIARLRLARVQIAQSKIDDAFKTLNGAEVGAFAARYHEVRGDAYHAKGDDASALKEYQAARIGDVAGTVDTELLDLKIADLPVISGTTSKPTQPAAAAAAK